MSIRRKPLLHSINADGSDAKIISDKYAGINTFSPDASRIAIVVASDSVTGIAVLNFPQLDNPIFVGPESPYAPNWSFNSNEIVFQKENGMD
jgi:hypothetical protein